MTHVVEFRDLEFEHEFATVFDYRGKSSFRWVPLGVPRISERMSRCVFFLFEHNQAGHGFVGPRGTGFLVLRQSRTLHGPCFHLYAVSNRHVINPSSTLRVNARAGGSTFIERDPSEWIFSDTDDLAAVDVTDDLLGNADVSISFISEHDFVDPASAPHKTSIGDQTIMLGLFSDHTGGGDHNLPVGRFGNLAAIPDMPVRLYPTDKFVRPAFLNDMRSRSGFSGSPVWTWRGPHYDMETSSSRLSSIGPGPLGRRATLQFIGVHRGQFQEHVRATESDFTDKFMNLSVPSSMTVVVPAWEVGNLLNDRRLEKQREARDQRDDRIAISRDYMTSTNAEEGSLPRTIFIHPSNDQSLLFLD